MSFLVKDLRKKSPLDVLRSKHRNSVASDHETTILDEFPIPDEYESNDDEQTENTHTFITPPPHTSPMSSAFTPQSSKYDEDYPDTHSIKSQKTIHSQISQAERRYKRYGHSYNGSLQENRVLSKPDLVRSHSVSRSWDASQPNNEFKFPE